MVLKKLRRIKEKLPDASYKGTAIVIKRYYRKLIKKYRNSPHYKEMEHILDMWIKEGIDGRDKEAFDKWSAQLNYYLNYADHGSDPEILAIEKKRMKDKEKIKMEMKERGIKVTDPKNKKKEMKE